MPRESSEGVKFERRLASSVPDASSGTDPEFPGRRNVLEAECARCPALVDSRECISWGTGSHEANIVVVGEAPGFGNPDADRWRGGNWTGKAYTSRHSGRRIRSMLERIGYGEDAYYTNAVKCFPADSDDPTTNREPTDEERETCRTHLLTELETVDPDAVLATGKHATATVLEAAGRSLEGFLETVLEPIRCDGLDVWLVPILHPSYQDVWIGRLGYEPAAYLEAIRETLEDVLE
ncbi:uracil-DNA glycosylase [Halostagnicola kamekurae]|uniref:Uracil-DNA glycosylase, family 4 n=1 Tax=Halostagnicola kamekurae TaxID=619731 RepID=A0A1I6PAH8_9EURY|nr:uracil-DNA glycosylase family protein [Halostagnicola kamekurae]SFS37098.1 uracil-DNA glycosylase, family 4 [Halostagnicola kamekurae]